MKNTIIWVVVVVILVLGVMFLGKSKKVDAPTGSENMEVGGEVNNATPAPGSLGTDVEEMVVEGQVKEFTVDGTNYKFEPSLITVKKGDKVKITFNSTQGFHDFVVDEFGAATKQIQSPGTEVIEFVADKVGSFEYYCSVGAHRSMGMVGTLKVE
jgi:plastocyanin